jgi:serine protease
MVAGYDFVNKDKDPYDDHGHGTHVAGTVAESTNNNEGVAGLAFEASIMPLKVLSAQGSGSSADIADAIRWAADHGANVINMSLGSSVPSEVIRNACKYAKKKNVVIVCAAGNGFGEPVGYPAAFPECIAVSSVGPSGNLAFYSSYGKQVALAAPGGDTTNGPQDGILQNTNFPEDQGGKGDDYYFFQGTSMASPHVAAVAALIEAQGVTDSARVKEILTSTATPKGEKKKYGAGILSAAGATDKAAAQVGANPFQFLVAAMAGIMLTMGIRRRSRSGMLRGAMAGALLLSFFGPDWLAARVGADSAWNLLGFSALLPLGLLLATRRNGAMVKIAGASAIGVVMAIAHDITVGAVPFTTATFGASALPWIYTNLGIALAVTVGVAVRAYRATRSISLR